MATSCLHVRLSASPMFSTRNSSGLERTNLTLYYSLHGAKRSSYAFHADPSTSEGKVGGREKAYVTETRRCRNCMVLSLIGFLFQACRIVGHKFFIEELRELLAFSMNLKTILCL